jgi:hypothetical protein
VQNITSRLKYDESHEELAFSQNFLDLRTHGCEAQLSISSLCNSYIYSGYTYNASFPPNVYTNCIGNAISCLPDTTRDKLLVDTMLPHLLLSSCRVGTRAQDSLHLSYAREHDLPSNKPPDTFVAGWASQTALVCPKFVEVLNALHGECEVHLKRFLDLHLVKADHGRKLIEEGAVEITRVQTEGEDRTLMTLSIDVYEVHLSLAAIASNRVIGRGVNVPALQIQCLIVVREAGV